MGQGKVRYRRKHRHVSILTSCRYDEICTKITPFLKSLGFNPKTDLTFIPVSAQIGENMKEQVSKKIAAWYELVIHDSPSEN